MYLYNNILYSTLVKNSCKSPKQQHFNNLLEPGL